MQDNHYKEAIRYYEPVVKKNADNLLSVTAIVLANLCVSYIMTSQVGTACTCQTCCTASSSFLAGRVGGMDAKCHGHVFCLLARAPRC